MTGEWLYIYIAFWRVLFLFYFVLFFVLALLLLAPMTSNSGKWLNLKTANIFEANLSQILSLECPEMAEDFILHLRSLQIKSLTIRKVAMYLGCSRFDSITSACGTVKNSCGYLLPQESPCLQVKPISASPQNQPTSLDMTVIVRLVREGSSHFAILAPLVVLTSHFWYLEIYNICKYYFILYQKQWKMLHKSRYGIRSIDLHDKFLADFQTFEQIDNFDVFSFFSFPLLLLLTKHLSCAKHNAKCFTVKYLSMGIIIIPIAPIYSKSGSWRFIQLGCNGTKNFGPDHMTPKCMFYHHAILYIYIISICYIYSVYIICIQYLIHFKYSIHNSMYLYLCRYTFFCFYNIFSKNWFVHRFAIRRMSFYSNTGIWQCDPEFNNWLFWLSLSLPITIGIISHWVILW